MAKRILSFLIALVILVTGLFTFPVSAVENENSVTTNSEDFTVNGTSSTGNLIANALSDVQAEQEENKGYNVFSATVEDNVVLLEAETLEDCTVVVAIYDEAGTTLITSGYSPLLVGETSVVVVLETEEMPQYFYLRAFLVDSNTFRPISTSYDCPNYTQEMQEFLAKTTADFEEEKVVNFDDSIDNNFAVYDDNTIIIPDDSTGNDVTSVDDELGVYIIENADESITSLVAGDIFAYEYNKAGDILIVKVAEITIDGTTATITGEETTLEEVFEYVKIDSTAGLENAEIDTSTLEEGMEYKGKIEKENNDDEPSTYAVDIEGSISQAFSYELYKKDFAESEEKEVFFSANLTLEMVASVKVYISLSHYYLELKLEPTIELTGEVTGKLTEDISLGKIIIPVVSGVTVTATPKLVFEVSGAISLSLKLETTIGMGIYKDEGFKDLTSRPKVEVDIEAEVVIFAGIRMEAALTAVSKRVAKATLGGQFGITMTITNNEAEDAIHLCNLCLKATTSFGVSFDVTVSLLNGKLEWKEEISFNIDVKELGNFYLSSWYDEIKKGDCPHIYYKTVVEVVDGFGEPVKDATINLDMYTIAKNVDASKIKDESQITEKSTHTTNEQGQVVGYLPNETYTAKVQKDNFSSGSKKFTVKDLAKNVKICINADNASLALERKTKTIASSKGVHSVLSNGSRICAAINNSNELYMWGQSKYGALGKNTLFNAVSKVPIEFFAGASSVALGSEHVAVITENNDLYMWGCNGDGQFGDGNPKATVTTPQFIMNNVVDVSLGSLMTAILTSDGSLYVCGSLYYYNEDSGSLGDGTTKTSENLIKVMSNVVDVEMGYDQIAAITNDGNLYEWGVRGRAIGGAFVGGLDKPTKVKISDVVDVSLGASESAAVTSNGDLYVWGYRDDSYVENPTKIMSNVVDCEFGEETGAAIKANGDLYMWGSNAYGQFGNGNISDTYNDTPVKVNSDVTSVSIGHDSVIILKNDGEMYTVGRNSVYQLGNGTQTDSSTPLNILSNIKSPSSVSTKTYGVNSFFADTVTTDTDIISEEMSLTEKTVSFTGLLGNEIYNFYVMKDQESALPFAADNLLYMTQVVSDTDGNLNITYTPTEECDAAEVFVKGMARTDISSSSIISYETKFLRGGASPKLDVVCNNAYLEEGVDYTFESRGTLLGANEVIITGIGDYTGSLTVEFETYCGHEYCTGTCLMCGEQKGDVDGDGQFNENDYAMILSFSAALATSKDSENCDLNGDGAVDTFDAMILDLRNAGILKSRAIGDADGDSIIDDSDYTSLSAVINEEQPITDTITELCDINSDGNIDAEDLLLLEKYLNGEYQIEQKYA